MKFDLNFNIIKSTLQKSILSKIFLVLIAVDLFFVLLHFYYFICDDYNKMYLISEDGSYAEFFQYLKEIILFILLIISSLKYKSKHLGVWAFLFIYLFLDDSLSIHENFEHWFLNDPEYIEINGIPIKDAYQLIPTAIFGFVFMMGFYFTYSDILVKKIKILSQALLISLVMLAFFGVLLDLIQGIGDIGGRVKAIFDLSEDFGEMIVMSLMLALAVNFNNAKIIDDKKV